MSENGSKAKSHGIDGDSASSRPQGDPHTTSPARVIGEPSKIKDTSKRRRSNFPEEINDARWKSRDRHFFILSSAGKPIYSRYGDEVKLSSLMASMQGIISLFADVEDSIRSTSFGDHKIVFLLKDNLYFIAASRVDNSEIVIREQLNYMYYQIVSIINNTNLRAIFGERPNADLRRYLEGSEHVLDHLVDCLDTDLCFSLGSLDVMNVKYSLREHIGKTLLEKRPKGLLYAIVASGMKLITILRPRKHSLHPIDLHLIFSMVNSSRTFNAPETCVPICLPRFNDKRFLNVYVSFIVPKVALILVYPARDSFQIMSEYRNNVTERLKTDGSMQRLSDLASIPPLSPDQMEIPGLLQFYYKSKEHLVYETPCETLFNAVWNPRRITRCYRNIRVMMLSTALEPHKICHQVNEEEVILGWNTSAFELYAAFSPNTDTKSITNGANSIIQWIRRERDQLFVIHSPSF
ncbi:Vacuolar fusion protein mon1 [Mycoemilia scoparia]|uniref:Vacuolar fusion protein MON1 n=1 Tax=Mycoemilia scoparia TaxID=417184 RepID=A0A9W7ZWQ2_9FUNG|nr:Vacuolar fusion protein mon1 [Mycoemilia scoparia]